ncbi:MAG: two-component regulator propeller domain-containing protein [Bacteroidota bacterium]
MHKFLYRILFIALLFSFPNKAQSQIYNFTNYTVEKGLSQPQILSVFQNDDGVMWFGTNGGGITKYDGNSYEYITDKDSLADNVVFCIAKYKNGKVLIGTNNGLSVFDPFARGSKKIKNYTTQNGLSHNRIFSIFFDAKGRVLLGTGKGISVFQDSVCSALNIEETLNNASVFTVFEDSKQNLWFSTLGNGAFKYNGKELHNYTSKDGLKNNFVYSVLEYKDNEYWLLANEGLYELNEKGIKLINSTLSTDATYYSYLKAKDNTIWIASNKGVLKYNGTDFQKFNSKNGLINDHIWKIVQDREQNIWFASKDNGVSKLDAERFYMYTVKDGLVFNEINCIHQSKDGGFLMGSDKGLSIFNGETFTNYTSKQDWVGNEEVLAITEDKAGNFLIGTSYGLLKHNPSTGSKKFEKIECEDKDKKGLNFIYTILIDSKGEIWVGTKEGVGKVIDGVINEFDQKGISKGFVFKIHEDKNGNHWFCGDEGLYMFDGSEVKHFSEKDGFIRKRVLNIVDDVSGSLWVATNSGLFKYTKGTFTGITEKEGLFSKNISSIAIDKKGFIWVGFSNGVDKIKPLDNGTYEINHYGIEDGFMGKESIFNSILIDKQERIWFGAKKGLVVYQPEHDRKNTLEPITRFKSINLFSQKTDWKLFSDSVDHNELPVGLELSHDRNYLTFNFIGVSLSTPTKVNYRFMLKGLDKDWLPETSKTEAVYSNIPPGSYEFLVMANNGEGVWNKEPVSFKFIVRPPFWQTWWFYSLITFIILIGIFSYIKIKTANKKILKQNEIIEEKNDALQHANSEIAEKNKNITDSINYAKRIQEAILPSVELIKKHLPNSFILYKPKDIVAGDFYWMEELDNTIFIAAADCTGHGVPGAMVSVICSNALNRSVKEFGLRETGKILDKVTDLVLETFEKSSSEVYDGMDISFLAINKSKKQIEWSGAQNPLWYFQDDKIVEIKPDKQPIGKYENRKNFTTQNVPYIENTIFYLFSDGLADQFGGAKGKKFMSKQFKKTLSNIYTLSMKEQELILEKAFYNWKGNIEQVDDVMVIGIKI